MKVSVSIALAGTVVAGLILGSYLSHPDRPPVLRGYRLPELLSPPPAPSERAAGASLVNHEPEPPLTLPALPERSAPADRGSETPSAGLNLSLPDMEWDEQSWHSDAKAYPDFFRAQEEDKRMNLSGRLHWDESEEARSLPITETILGAEVEVQVRLP